jgi:hypothetical protein
VGLFWREVAGESGTCPRVSESLHVAVLWGGFLKEAASRAGRGAHYTNGAGELLYSAAACLISGRNGAAAAAGAGARSPRAWDSGSPVVQLSAFKCPPPRAP